MRITIGLIAGIVFGLAFGWYLGYTRPVVKANRDAQKYLTSIEHDDRMMVVVALHAISDMEKDQSAEAKELLAHQIGSYYVIYGPPDNPKKRIPDDRMRILRTIEEAAHDYPVIQQAIDKSKQNLNK